MSLLQPQLLWLLAAIAIPIAVHLYNRKRAVRRRFPTLEFLLRSNKLLARKLKLRQVLLLALRIGIFLLIPLAIARPYLLSDAGITADEKLPAAVVFVVDDSLSMQATTNGQSHYALALEAIDETLDNLRSFDEVALVFASAPDDPAVIKPSDDVSAVRDALEAHSVTSQRVDNRRALEVARDIALTSELPVRKVVLVTDQTLGSWPEPLGSDIFGGSALVDLIDVGRVNQNGYVSRAWSQPAASGERGAFEVVAEFDVSGVEEIVEATAELQRDGETLASSEVALNPEAAVQVVFNHRSDASDEVLTIVLDMPGDDLGADDRQDVIVGGTQQINVLLVNGDPRTVAYQDELYYLERALLPSADSISLIKPRLTTREGLQPSDLDEVDVVVLSNVASVDPAQASALTRFVEDGGGLLMTMGDRVDPVAYNRLLSDLLPKPLRSERRLANMDDPDAALKVTRYDQLDYDHPIMRPFALPGGETLQSVEVYAYMLVEPRSGSDTQILASFADGGPALLERRVGAGRVMLSTTTFDRDWTPLPIKKPFLPLTRRLMSYLARRGSGDARDTAVVGQPFVLSLDGYRPSRVEVLGPDGDAQTLSGTALSRAQPAVVVEKPGVHRVVVTENGVAVELDALSFVARVDNRESVVGELSDEELSALWPAPDSDSSGPDTGFDAQRRLELWPILLLVAMILLYLETLVGLRRNFYQRLRQMFTPG